MEIWTKPIKYIICGLPEENVDSSVWQLTVEWRGDDRWAVCRHSMCLSVDGTWDYEAIPSSRTDDWIATHRFSKDRALELAVKEYPNLVINGLCVRNGELVSHV